MEQGFACLAAILESADPALQVPAEVGHRVAQRLQAEIGYLSLFSERKLICSICYLFSNIAQQVRLFEDTGGNSAYRRANFQTPHSSEVPQ